MASRGYLLWLSGRKKKKACRFLPKFHFTYCTRRCITLQTAPLSACCSRNWVFLCLWPEGCEFLSKTVNNLAVLSSKSLVRCAEILSRRCWSFTESRMWPEAPWGFYVLRNIFASSFYATFTHTLHPDTSITEYLLCPCRHSTCKELPCTILCIPVLFLTHPHWLPLTAKGPQTLAIQKLVS